MPRRYSINARIAKLNALVKINKSADNETAADQDDSSTTFTTSDSDEDDGRATCGGKPPNGRHMEQRCLLEYTPHFAQAEPNKGICVNEMLNMYPACSVTVPLPLHVAATPTPVADPCMARPIAHCEWTAQLGMHHEKYKQSLSKMKLREKKHQHKIYNTRLFDLAEHLATQENTYFKDSYDYHYTGGNLGLLPYYKDHASKMLVLHASGEKLQQLHFSELDKETEQLQPLYTASYSEMSSEIFEVLPIHSFRLNHGNMFMSRFLNEIAIYEFKADDVKRNDQNYMLKCHGKFSSHDGPFISAAQSHSNAETLAIACQDDSIRLLDLVQQKDISKHDVCIIKGLHQTKSTWAQLCCATQESCFYYACQPVLFTIDMRCAGQPMNPCFASSAHSNLCERFSCIARSSNPNLLYVGSNHKIHCLDMRCLGKKLSDRSVVTWTHLMTYSPTFIDTCLHEGSEYVAMCSPLPNDQRLCELIGATSENVTVMSSPALPYSPPMLEEAYIDCTLRGHVDVYADLADRIKRCITGLKFHKFEKAYDNAFAQLLTANSMGDVYSQRVTIRDEQESVQELRTGLHSAEAVRYYAGLVHKNVQKIPGFTEVQHIPVLRDIMRSERLTVPEEKVVPERTTIDWESDDSEDSTKSEESPSAQQQNITKSLVVKKNGNPPKAKESSANKKKLRPIYLGAWQKSLYELSKYKDMMSPRLLSVWDLDEYDQKPDITMEMLDKKVGQTEMPQSIDHVNRWLTQLAQNTPINSEAPSTSLVEGTNLPKIYEAKQADFVELTSVAVEPTTPRQAPSILQPGEFTIIEQNATEVSSPKPPAKRARTKTKYQIGF